MGARMLRAQLNREGFDIGRKHLNTLIKHIGVEGAQKVKHQQETS